MHADKEEKIWDYLVVGAGPTGLVFAQCLSKTGLSIAVLEREAGIGGCHRVRRERGDVFTEHGPRVYSSAYETFRKDILPDLGTTFEKEFVPYQFDISRIGMDSVRSLRWRELAWLVIGSIIAAQTSVHSFGKRHNFSASTMDYLDRLCRLTDGAGSERYTVGELVALVNEQSLQRLYQPRLPTDVGLFKRWREVLESRRVQFFLNQHVRSVSQQHDDTSGLIVVESASAFRQKRFLARRIIFACSPLALASIVPQPVWSRQWIRATTYDTYLSVMIQWSMTKKGDVKRPKLPSVWGFPRAEWGVAFVVMSDYFEDATTKDQLLISAAVTRLDVPTMRPPKKTANQCASAQEIFSHVLEELYEALPILRTLPQPHMYLNPGNRYDSTLQRWTDRDSAFVKSAGQVEAAPATGGSVLSLGPSMYSVGTHNGRSPYSFTSLESACCNAVACARDLEPQRVPFRVRRTWTLAKVLASLALLLLSLGIVCLLV